MAGLVLFSKAQGKSAFNTVLDMDLRLLLKCASGVIQWALGSCCLESQSGIRTGVLTDTWSPEPEGGSAGPERVWGVRSCPGSNLKTFNI